jgi:hypothetical protein
MLALDKVFDRVNVLAAALPRCVIVASASGVLRVVFDLVLRWAGIGDGRDQIHAVTLVDTGDSGDFHAALLAGINPCRDAVGNVATVKKHSLFHAR